MGTHERTSHPDTGRVQGRLHGAWLACAWALGTGTFGVAWSAPKTDVVTLSNGDRITGEIKKLERGLLVLKTDALGTVEIEWPEIVRIESGQLLEIEQNDHRRYVGHVAGTDGEGNVLLASQHGDGVSPVPMPGMVAITPLSEGAWLDRVDGRASLGFSAASANGDRQVSLSAEMSYRDESHRFDASYAGARTKSEHNPELRQQSAEALYRWFPHERRFWAIIGSATTNDELDLELRSLFGAGVGGYWLRDSWRELWGLVGLAAIRERYRGGDGRHHLEAVLQGNLEIFRFDDPRIDVITRLAVYPSLSVGGRVRSEWSLRARAELVKDLYYELSYMRSQDNKPPGGDGRLVDWSLVSSFGYKF